MERIIGIVKVIGLTAVVLLGSSFLRSAELRASGDENFPISRFGAPPVPKLGADAIKPGAEAEHWDSVSRSPASITRENHPPETDDGTIPPTAPQAPALNANNNPELSARAMARRGVQEVALIASDLGYFPKTVFVARDIPVRLFVTGSSKNTLCIMLDSFQVRKQVRSQRIEEITFTPSQPGTYRFYCPLNGMEGSLVVKELVSNQ